MTQNQFHFIAWMKTQDKSYDSELLKSFFYMLWILFSQIFNKVRKKFKKIICYKNPKKTYIDFTSINPALKHYLYLKLIK